MLPNRQSGRYRHFVEFYSKPTEPDDFGDPQDLTLVKDARANVIVRSGDQMDNYGTVLTSQIITVKFRYDSDVTNSMYLKWNSDTYEIKHISPDEHDFEAIITAELVSRGI